MNPLRRGLLLVPPLSLALLALWTIVASWVTLWGIGMMEAIPYPSWQWWGYLTTPMPDAVTADFMNRWLLIGAGSASFVTVAVLFRVVTDAKALFGLGDRELHGTSRFSTRSDGERAGLIYGDAPRPDCLILGRTRGFLGIGSRFVMLPGVEHVMLYARTGSGKGVSYVVPNCLNYADSLVALDIKGENHRYTAGHRKKRLRQDVFLFSPLVEDGHTHCWNPLGDVSVNSPDYISKLQRKAFDIFPPTDGKDKFWQDGARSAFLGIAVLVAETPGMALNPGTVFEHFTRGDSVETLARMIDERRKAGTPYTQTCINLISDYLTGTEEVVKGIRKHVTSTMSLWFNPKIVAATAHSDFNLRDLRRKKMTVYVGVMPSDLDQLGVLLRLFFLQLFEANTDVMPEDDRTVKHRCHVLLDEFTAIPAMKAIAKSAGFARGFWLHFSFIVQSKGQVREEYKGHGESSLIDNLGAEIIFGTNNPQLCKEASERAGYDTVTATTRTAPRFMAWFRAKEQNQSEHAHRRPLLLPQEVARLPKGMQLLFRDTAPPFLLRRLRWFTDPLFRDLQSSPPPVPAVSYTLARDDGSVQIQAPASRSNPPATVPVTP